MTQNLIGGRYNKQKKFYSPCSLALVTLLAKHELKHETPLEIGLRLLTNGLVDLKNPKCPESLPLQGEG